MMQQQARNRVLELMRRRGTDRFGQQCDVTVHVYRNLILSLTTKKPKEDSNIWCVNFRLALLCSLATAPRPPIHFGHANPPSPSIFFSFPLFPGFFHSNHGHGNLRSPFPHQFFISSSVFQITGEVESWRLEKDIEVDDVKAGEGRRGGLPRPPAAATLAVCHRRRHPQHRRPVS